MARADRTYVRIYYIDLQRDYPQVWFDPTALATWIRLLTRMDQSWPAAPELPTGVRKADLGILTSCGLVALNGHGTYLLKGYEAERGRRHAAAKTGAEARWKSSERNANASPDALRSQSEGISERNAKSLPKPNPNPKPKDSQHGKPSPGRAASAPADVEPTDGPGDPEWLRG